MKTFTYASLVFCGVLAAVAIAAPSVSAQGTSPTLVKELVATWQRAATELVDGAEAMPEEKYGYKPTPEIATFRDQLIHVAGVTQRFIDTSKGVKTEAGHAKATTKADVIALLKQTFQTAQETLGSLNDAQLLEQVEGLHLHPIERAPGNLHVEVGAALRRHHSLDRPHLAGHGLAIGVQFGDLQLDRVGGLSVVVVDVAAQLGLRLTARGGVVL